MNNQLNTHRQELAEESAHSFVIRIWLEEITSETNEPLWRGHITHVVSGKRQYFQQLNHLLPFIRSFMK